MNELPASPTLVWFIISTASGGGLWFVIRLIRQYQRDFTDRYAARLAELEVANEKLDRRNYELQQESIAFRVELGAARAALRANGIEWSEEVWNVGHPRLRADP